MDRNDILDAARHCINGHREQDYGKPENNFARIAGLWEAYTGREYTPEQVAVMLALLKIARLGSGRPHPDNYVDLAGYAALAGELAGQAEPQAVEPLGAAESPQEPRNGPGGPGAFTPCTPLGSIKLRGEKRQEGRPALDDGAELARLTAEDLETLRAAESEAPEPVEAESPGKPRLIIGGKDYSDFAARCNWEPPAGEGRVHIVGENGKARPMTGADVEAWENARAERAAIRKGLETMIREAEGAGMEAWQALEPLDGAVVHLLDTLHDGLEVPEALDRLAGEIWKASHPGGVWEV